MIEHVDINRLYKKSWNSFFKYFLSVISITGIILTIISSFSPSIKNFILSIGVIGIILLVLLIALISLLLVFREFKNKVIDSDLLFYNVHERSKAGIDVKGCIKSSKKEIFISGCVLLYVVKSCSEEMLFALNNGCEITIILSKSGSLYKKTYERFSSGFSQRIITSKSLYIDFYNKLSSENQKRFNVKETDNFLTHSIGFYDNKIFISEFCMNTDSSKVPSYFVDENSDAFKPFEKEIKILKWESISILK